MTDIIIPQGIELLKGPRRSEAETIQCLDKCCESHPDGCGYEWLCRKLHTQRMGTNPRDGGWKWGRYMYPGAAPKPKYCSETQRYANTLPVLSFATVRDKIRQNIYGGML